MFLVAHRATASGGGEKIVLDPMVIFHQAVENVKPTIATQTVRKGGKGYHVRMWNLK